MASALRQPRAMVFPPRCAPRDPGGDGRPLSCSRRPRPSTRARPRSATRLSGSVSELAGSARAADAAAARGPGARSPETPARGPVVSLAGDGGRSPRPGRHARPGSAVRPRRATSSDSAWLAAGLADGLPRRTPSHARRLPWPPRLAADVADDAGQAARIYDWMLPESADRWGWCRRAPAPCGRSSGPWGRLATAAGRFDAPAWTTSREPARPRTGRRDPVGWRWPRSTRPAPCTRAAGATASPPDPRAPARGAGPVPAPGDGSDLDGAVSLEVELEIAASDEDLAAASDDAPGRRRG